MRLRLVAHRRRRGPASRRRAIALVLLFAAAALGMQATVVQASGTAHTTTITRVPPYDYGCLVTGVVPYSLASAAPERCDIPSDDARQGTLRGGRVPLVGLTFLLTPYLSTYDYGSRNGIYVHVAHRFRIAMSAVVRNTDLVDLPPNLGMEVCLSVMDLPRGAVWNTKGNCKQAAASGAPTKVSVPAFGMQPDLPFLPGRYLIFVSLRAVQPSSYVAGPSEVFVERITVHMTRWRR